MKKPEGAYAQLIQLQGAQQDAEVHNDDPDMIIRSDSGSRSINVKPRSQSTSFRRSITKGSSFGHSGRHPIPAPLDFPDPMEFKDDLGMEETTDKVPRGQKKASISRLFYLNKPEAFVLVLGSVTAAMHGLMFPIFGILISSAIKMFYEPPSELLKDSRFWASMFVVVGASAFVLIPTEYFLFGLAGGKLVERIRSLTFRSVMHQEINWFDKPEHSRCVHSLSLIILSCLLSYDLFYQNSMFQYLHQCHGEYSLVYSKQLNSKEFKNIEQKFWHVI